MAIERNITASDDWFLGEDKILNWVIYQADDTTIQDITGWAITWMLKKRATDADLSAKLTKTASITNGPAGTCSVSIVDTDTDALPAGTYMHELKRTDDGSETVLTHGHVTLRQAVQR